MTKRVRTGAPLSPTGYTSGGLTRISPSEIQACTHEGILLCRDIRGIASQASRAEVFVSLWLVCFLAKTDSFGGSAPQNLICRKSRTYKWRPAVFGLATAPVVHFGWIFSHDTKVSGGPPAYHTQPLACILAIRNTDPVLLYPAFPTRVGCQRCPFGQFGFMLVWCTFPRHKPRESVELEMPQNRTGSRRP